jgi:hypothetical protein
VRVDLAFADPSAPLVLARAAEEVEREAAALDLRSELLKKEIAAPGIALPLKALKQKRLEEVLAQRSALAQRQTAGPLRGNAFSVQFLPLESTFPSDPEVQKVVATYDGQVGQLNLAWAKEHGEDCPAAPKGKPAFVGNEACRDCHEETFAVWDASKHAHAYATLVEGKKQFDLECVRCHVTGADLPGGVCRVDKVEGRKDVGCESCHGPGSQHVTDPATTNVLARPSAEGCVGCHNPENSPHFDFALYLPKILGPGHGAGARDGGAR